MSHVITRDPGAAAEEKSGRLGYSRDTYQVMGMMMCVLDRVCQITCVVGDGHD